MEETSLRDVDLALVFPSSIFVNRLLLVLAVHTRTGIECQSRGDDRKSIQSVKAGFLCVLGFLRCVCVCV